MSLSFRDVLPRESEMSTLRTSRLYAETKKWFERHRGDDIGKAIYQYGLESRKEQWYQQYFDESESTLIPEMQISFLSVVLSEVIVKNFKINRFSAISALGYTIYWVLQSGRIDEKKLPTHEEYHSAVSAILQ